METNFLVKELLNFPLHPVKTYWVIGNSVTGLEEEYTQAKGKVVLFTAPIGLKPFSGFQALFEALRTFTKNKNILGEKASNYWEALLVEYPALFGGVVTSHALYNPAAPLPEFTSTTSFLEDLARFLEICLKTLGIDRVVCTNSHQLDALSLRLLARFHQIAELEEVSFVYHFPLDPRAERAIPDTFNRFRQQLFLKLTCQFAPEIVETTEQGEKALHPLKEMSKKAHALAIFEECTSFQESLGELVTAIKYQTLDRAYLVCDRMLKLSFGQPTEQGLILGFLALLQTLSGQSGAALETIEAARQQLPHKPLLLAHLYYLQGLIVLESGNNRMMAQLSFRQGLALLRQLAPATPAKALGQAWLYYGLSVLYSPDESHETSFRSELELEYYPYQALQLLDTETATPATGFLYPRLQLQLALMWRNTEGTFLELFEGLGSLLEEPSRRVESSHLYQRLAYRLGIKYYQTGQLEKGLKYLNQARRHSELNEDNYSLVRILYTLGLLYCESGKLVKGQALFEQGIGLARRQHDWEGLRRHLLGWLWFRPPSKRNNSFEETDLSVSLRTLFKLCNESKGEAEATQQYYQKKASWLELPQFEEELAAVNPSIDLGYSEVLLDWAVSIFHFCGGSENPLAPKSSPNQSSNPEVFALEEELPLLRPISPLQFAIN